MIIQNSNRNTLQVKSKMEKKEEYCLKTRSCNKKNMGKK